jgi:nitrite reductase/ring-hydroxylating ferredoxin subunit
MKDVLIGKAAAFPDPGRKVVEVDGTEVGVFCRNGKFSAFENICPTWEDPSARARSSRACTS